MDTPVRQSRASKLLFWMGCTLCTAPLAPLPTELGSLVAPLALIAGMALALTAGNPFARKSSLTAKNLLQASVVLLGFSMDLHKVAETGRSGLTFSLISIASVFGAGWLLQRVLKVRSATALLVSAGTAICGGSAIAAMSSVCESPEEDVTVAVGTVFLLNALALLLFPPIGRLLGLSQKQFGVWSGIAIHDIASVVGAGTAYGREALNTATAVKLSRVLYIVPITLFAAWLHQRTAAGRHGKIQIPWFVAFFLLASFARSSFPLIALHTGDVKRLATAGFALSLFLIGAGMTRATLKAVGLRPLLLGAALWLFISAASLAAVEFA